MARLDPANQAPSQSCTSLTRASRVEICVIASESRRLDALLKAGHDDEGKIERGAAPSHVGQKKQTSASRNS
jgi:hypothetical protein